MKFYLIPILNNFIDNKFSLKHHILNDFLIKIIYLFEKVISIYSFQLYQFLANNRKALQKDKKNHV